MTGHRFLLSAFAIFAGVACSKKPPGGVQYGEPVGVKVDAAGSPAYEIAFAVSKGTDAAPLVPALTEAMHKAVAACPAFVKDGQEGQIASFTFTIDEAVIHKGKSPEGESQLVPSPGTQCVVAQLEGKSARPSAGHLDGLMEVRFAAVPK
jgi:hypothetical protein